MSENKLKTPDPLWGTARCLDCDIEWQTFCPDGLDCEYLECPKCLVHRGVLKDKENYG